MIGYFLGVIPALLGQVILLFISLVGAELLPAILESTTGSLAAAAM